MSPEDMSLAGMSTDSMNPQGSRGSDGPGARGALRQICREDLGALIDLNNSEVPKVGPLTEDTAEQLIEFAALLFALGDPLEAFCVALPPGTQYGSANYRWVSERYDSFIYLDRICVAPSAQRRGYGRALYEAIEQNSDSEWFLLEVNTRPENPESLAFHAALGFVELGRAEPYGDGTEVAYFGKRLREHTDASTES